MSIIKNKKTCLGICLGMQIIFENLYEEKFNKGLKILRGNVNLIQNKNKKIILPHIGWNNIEVVKKSPVFYNIKNNTDFYFLHSYTPYEFDNKFITSYVGYSGIKIASSLEVFNFIGVQFHPEKSGSTGLVFLKNWLNSINN